MTVDHRKEFIIKAVFRDVHSNSSLRFEFVLPMEVHVAENKWLEHWGNSSMQLYVKLREDTVLKDVNTKIERVLLDHYKGTTATIFFAPLIGICTCILSLKMASQLGGRIEYVRYLHLCAVFILCIACINFMNLGTARYYSARTRDWRS